MNEFVTLWRGALKQKIAVACFREGSDELVGLNLLCVMTEQDQKNLPEPKSMPFITVFSAILAVFNSENVFKKYNVDKYVSALGLSVDPKYRGLGLSTHILKARLLF